MRAAELADAVAVVDATPTYPCTWVAVRPLLSEPTNAEGNTLGDVVKVRTLPRCHKLHGEIMMITNSHCGNIRKYVQGRL